MKKSTVLIAILALILQGCGPLQVNLMNPNPNLDLIESKQKIILLIDDGISNEFEIPEKNGVRPINVTEWHSSLKKGFENGFKDYYTIVENKENADLILELTRADLEFVPAAISGSYGVVAINSQIDFKAILKNNNNEVLNSDAGTSVSKNATNQPSQVTSVVESSVESMYEILSKEIFEN
ncbi:hypothetical protein [Mesonia sp. K4-1]|uniref:hypothetical protein n=1 Tax=Mesonia sp. K4-1 TaxID=2602760 RepID=UPI0011CA5999|nr:hypothetical protein [Mesonia sp. K4-1]TXK71967.1 hypothetical protein FT986_15035 [Mesonia sp. K4-1]